MNKFKALANFAFSVFVVFAIYINYMESSGNLDPEVGYDFFDLGVLGKILAMLLNLSLFPTILISMKHAWDRGKYIWVFLNAVFFPAIYYMNFLYTLEEDEPSFKGITKRVNQ